VSRPRLLVVNQYYTPAFEATAQLLTQLCEALAEDYQVTVVTGVVEGTRPGREVLNGVEVIRVFSTAYERRRLALRATNYLTYSVSSIWKLLTGSRPDVVICMSDPPFVADLAYLAARRARAPYIVISQDVFPEIAVALGRLKNPVLVRILAGMIGFAVRRADRGGAIGETIRSRMNAWQGRFDEIGDVRGLGAMLAIELVHDRDSKDPAPELVSKVCEEALQNGLLLLSAGIYSNVVRVLVPLTISDAELQEALGVWEHALECVLTGA